MKVFLMNSLLYEKLNENTSQLLLILIIVILILSLTGASLFI